MTEEEWLNADDVLSLIQFLRKTGTERKRQLLACAMCRSILHLLPDVGLGMALDLVETEHSRKRHHAHASSLVRDARKEPSDQRMRQGLAAVLSATNRTSWASACSEVEFFDRNEEVTPQRVSFVHCIFGNPFRPITFLPECRTSTVIALAHQMYDSRDFSVMPILADALQDTGCSDEAILTHCRGHGPHVRGCWVVDGCLSKT